MDASPSPTIEIHPGPVDTQGRATADFAYIADEGWAAVGKLVYTSSLGVAIREITISGTPFDDDGFTPVTSNVLRHVPTGKILASALAVFTEASDLPALPRENTKRQPGRQPLSDDLLMAVAAGYLLETRPGQERGAIKRLASRMGKPMPTVSRWVMRARSEGWLGPAIPGREGAEATEQYISAVGTGAVGDAMLKWLRITRQERGELINELTSTPPEITEPPEE